MYFALGTRVPPWGRRFERGPAELLFISTPIIRCVSIFDKSPVLPWAPVTVLYSRRTRRSVPESLLLSTMLMRSTDNEGSCYCGPQAAHPRSASRQQSLTRSVSVPSPFLPIPVGVCDGGCLRTSTES